MNVKHLAALIALLFVAACGAPERAAPTRSPTPPPTVRPTPSPTPKPRDPFALARSYDASSAADLARSLASTAGSIAGVAKRQQALYRQLVRTPEWRADVYKRLDEDAAATARANVEAGERLRMLTPPKTALPPWRIVPPPPAGELRSHYDGAGKEFGVDWTYLAAIHLVETRMGRIRGTSDAGAKGPMQFLPSTWTAYGEGDIEDPRDAIRAAARYLKAHGAPGDMARALFAYNHSDHYVRAVQIYASRMRGGYAAYYHWDVYYRTTKGDALLYEGWPSK